MLAGTLIGLSAYGVDLSATLFGTPWRSPLPDDRVAMALKGVIVTVTILFGSLLVAGIIALAVGSEPAQEKPEEKKSQP